MKYPITYLVTALLCVSISGCSSIKRWISNESTSDALLVYPHDQKESINILKLLNASDNSEQTAFVPSKELSESTEQDYTTQKLMLLLQTMRDIAANDPSPENVANYRIAYREVMQRTYMLNSQAKQPVEAPRSHEEQAYAAQMLVGTSLPQGFVRQHPLNTALYFDYDSALLKKEFNPVVIENAQFITSHPSMRVMVAGFADNRGNAEYNQRLGKRRAEKVATALIARGVRPEQISVVSYGQFNPAVAQENEDAYALNRRVEIVY